MQKISQSEYQHSQQLTTAAYNTFTVITLNNFMTSVYLPPEIAKEELYA